MEWTSRQQIDAAPRSRDEAAIKVVEGDMRTMKIHARLLALKVSAVISVQKSIKIVCRRFSAILVVPLCFVAPKLLRSSGGDMRKLIFLAVPLVCFMLGLTPCAFPQATTGTILGTVVDATGAMIAGAEVSATNKATNLKQTDRSGPDGSYRLAHLVPGSYTVSVTMQGFKSLSRSVDLLVDQQISLNLPLTVGAVGESVTVTAATPLLQTHSVETGQVMETHEILDLPLLGRNVLDLTQLTTGVTKGVGGNSDNISVNGGREFANSVVLGGIEVTGNRNNDTSITPSVDAVQEFKIVTSAYSAEFGRASGAVILLETKPGGNKFHGSVYDFYRPGATAARDYFDTTPSQLNQNNFGATLGGPIKKDRTFFFGSYEGLRNHDGSSSLTNLPPTNQIKVLGDGSVDLSGLVDPYTGNQIPIFDPVFFSQNYYSQQFPGNIIPANEVSQAGLATLQNFFPHPTLAGDLFGWENNGVANYKTSFNSDTVDTRIDHTLSSNDQLSGEYHYARFNSLVGDQYAGQIPVQGGGGADTSNNTFTKNQAVAISETHTFSPRLVNEFRFGFNNFALTQLSLLNGRNLADQFGAHNVNTPGFPQSSGFPQMYFSGWYETIGGSTYEPLNFLDRNYQFVDHMSLTRGSHQIKFGGEYRSLSSRPGFSLFPTSYQYYQGGNYQPSLTSDASYGFIDYSAYYTYGGSDIADLLVGLPTYTYMGLQLTNPETKSWELHGFAQDEWRVSKKVSVFYGMRYEYQNPYYDVHNQSTNFDLVSGNILLAGRGGHSSALINADKNNFGPRVGFAYQFDTRTVLRGGYGIYYSPENDAREDVLTKNYPFNNQQSFTDGPYGFPYQLDAGVPRTTSIDIPQGASFVDPSTIPDSTSQGVYYVNPNIRTGYSQLYNLTVQREVVPNLSVEVGFVGSMSHKLSYAVGNINIDPATGQPAYPALGHIQGLQSFGSGNYNSLQVKATKRYSNHLSFLVAYTYGKSIDNGPAPFNLGRGHQQPQDPFNLAAERSVSANDIAHNLVGSFSYELPIGKGRMMLGNLNRWEDAVLGGWQINGIVGMHSGLPVNIVQNGSVQNFQGLRPNLVHDPRLSHPTIGKQGQYFDPSAFCDHFTSPACLDANEAGDLGRNAVRGPGFFNMDFSLFKNLALTERAQLQLRVEAFNLTNTPQFGSPNSDMAGGYFGKVTGTVGNPRVMQFAVKLNF